MPIAWCKDTCLLSRHCSPIAYVMAAFAVYKPAHACLYGKLSLFLSLPFSSCLSPLRVACLSSHSSRCSALIVPRSYASHVLSLCVLSRSGPQCSPPRRASTWLLAWLQTQCDFEVVSVITNENEKTGVEFNYESLSFFDRQKTKW